MYATCQRATVENGLNVSAIIGNQIKTDAAHCFLYDVLSGAAIIQNYTFHPNTHAHTHARPWKN